MAGDHDAAARWLLLHPGLGSARLLTARGHLQRAVSELDQLLGMLEVDAAPVTRLELGMERVVSRLVNATKSLDVVPIVRKT